MVWTRLYSCKIIGPPGYLSKCLFLESSDRGVVLQPLYIYIQGRHGKSGQKEFLSHTLKIEYIYRYLSLSLSQGTISFVHKSIVKVLKL